MPKIHAESSIIQDIISNPQSTHRQIVSNSVGMALLQLRRNYPNTSRKYLKELNKIQDKAIKPAIQYILNKIEEPINNDLDTLSLFFSTGEKKYTFPLKEVLSLVWQAENDHEKYTQNYSGTPAEKLAQAEKDLPQRLSSFYKCLSDIESKPICHHGDRNELIFPLNKTYAGIDLIEDERGTVLSFLKDNITELFSKTYRASTLTRTGEREKLRQALFQWMSESNANDILALVDPQNTLEGSLNNLFIQHGSNPEKIKLGDMIKEALSYLDFACDPARYPVLAKINSILNAPEYVEDEITAAVTTVQDWIKTTCQIHDENHKKIISAFYAVFEAWEILQKDRYLLSMTGRMSEDFNTLSKICAAHFSDIKKEIKLLTISNETEILIGKLKDAVSKAKADTMSSEIENFFARWFIAANNNDTSSLKRLYGLLVDDTFQNKIILNDNEIAELIQVSAKPDEGYQDITPYQVNRLFLHAFLIEPQDWSEIFKKIFHDVLQFVENNFNRVNAENAKALKKDSYPPELMQQLKYLDGLSRQAGVARPEKMLLLPHHIKTAKEWRQMARIFGDEKLKLFYQPIAVKINHLLFDEIMLKDSPEDKLNLLHASIVSIPETERLSFLTNKLGIGFVKDNIIKDSEPGRHVAALMSVLPEADRLSFLANMFKLEDVKGFINIEGFYWLLGAVPKAQRLSFIDKLGVEFVKNTILKNVDPGLRLRELLWVIPEEEIFSFLSDKLGIKFFKDVLDIGSYELGLVLKTFPEVERIPFLINKLGLAYVKVIAERYLADLLSAIPEDKKLGFLTETLGLAYVKQSILKHSDKLHVILNELPEAERLPFLINKLGSPFVKNVMDKSGCFGLILETIPKVQVVSFMTDKLGIEFVRKIIKKNIKDSFELYYFIKAVPESELFSFVTDKLGIVFVKDIMKDKGCRLDLILEMIPEAGRLSFITTRLGIGFFKEVFKGNSHRDKLERVLVLLPEEERLSFIIDKLGLEFFKNEFIKSSYDVAFVLRSLPEKDKLSFITDHLTVEFLKSIMSDCEELASILRMLPESERLPFLTETLGISFVKAVILNQGRKWLDVLKELPESGKISLLTNELSVEFFKKLISDSSRMSAVLETFSISERSSLFTHKVWVEHVQNLMKEENCNLDLVLEAQSEGERLSFLTNTLGINIVKNAISSRTLFVPRDNDNLFTVLKTLPKAERFSFLTEYLGIEFVKKMIIGRGVDTGNFEKYRISRLFCILKTLSESERLSFVDKLGMDFVKDVFMELPVFGRSINLGRLLESFPVANRLSFVTGKLGLEFVNKEMIKNPCNLSNVSGALADADKLSFLEPYQHISKELVQDIWRSFSRYNNKAFSFASFFSASSVMPRAYNNAMRAATDRERFSVLSDYIINQKNKNDAFHQKLVDAFGDDFFIKIPCRELVSEEKERVDREEGFRMRAGIS